MSSKIMQIAEFLIAFYFISKTIGYFYRKSWFFNKYSLLKSHYLMALDIELLILMLKNHSVNEHGKVVGFEDMKGNLLPYNRVFDLFHTNNLQLNLGLYVNKNDINEYVIDSIDLTMNLFMGMCNLNKKDDPKKYEKYLNTINSLYLSIRSIIVSFQANQNNMFLNLKDFNEPKSLSETKILKFITI